MYGRIEAGCLAMIISSAKESNLGRIVTVIERATGPVLTQAGLDHGLYWRVDVEHKGRYYVCVREDKLMRIDNPSSELESMVFEIKTGDSE